MTLLILAYLGGLLTLISPCVLPVLPLIFARAGQPFLRSGLPLLLGMALSFAAVASLAAVGGGWAVQANRYGRLIALGLMAVFALALLMPALAHALARPFVALGARLSSAAQAAERPSLAASLALGVATGLLWTPCAGPVLGLVLAGAALGGASVQTSLLLLAYASGAATALGAALLLGGRVFQAMKTSLGAGVWLRRGLGVMMLVSVLGIGMGADKGILMRLSLGSTTALEQALLSRVPAQALAAVGGMPDTAGPQMDLLTPSMADSAVLQVSARAQGGPSLEGAVQWLNSPPLSLESLKGKVVLVDFWTYSCINCLRTLPYVRAWANKYRDQGLVVIGVHAPEFAFEKDLGNVRKAVRDLQVDYAVAVDNDFKIWRSFQNRYWPAHYFIDAQGKLRHRHFGEGGDVKSERVIQQLLAEAGPLPPTISETPLKLRAEGVGQAPDSANMRSQETYLGHARAERFASPGGLFVQRAHDYQSAGLRLNQWALSGRWNVGSESAQSLAAPASIHYQFHARDLHLVMGGRSGEQALRFQVLLDGAAPGKHHGVDVDAQGMGVIRGQRLYQLVRQSGPVETRSFEIRFLDPGAQAFAFSFG